MRPFDPRLLPHLAPARAPLAGVVAAGVAGGLLVVVQAFAVAWLVTALLEGGASGSWDGARHAAGLLVAVTLGRAGASWVGDACAARASTEVTTTLRRRLLRAALAGGPFALTRHRAGELAALATRGVGAVDPYLTRYLPALVVAAVLPPLTVLAIATQDVLSAVIVLATLPLVPVFAVLVGLVTRDRADRQWRALARLSGHFLDVVRGLPTLVAYRRAEVQSGSIRAITDRYRRATLETLKVAFASSAVLELVATLSVALVAVTVGLRLSEGGLDLQTALVVLLLAPEAYWPLRRVGAEFHAAAEGTATFEAADAILAGAGAVDASDPRPTGPDGAAVPADPAVPWTRDGIRLERVTVGYPGRDEPVLTGVSAHLPGRGITAVTGPSGSGKSTLLAALLGHLPLTDGSITVRGTDVAAGQEHTGAWQRHVAWVPQRPWIAAASVADNVRLARPDATDDEVWMALERVGLGEVVAALPGGLDERLGEDGAGLSAGERARLALARAVVAERPVVVLDEPTAHLDVATENVIADTLTWLGRRASVVVVAHRPRLVELADRVLDIGPWSPAARDHDAKPAPRGKAVPATAVEPPSGRSSAPTASDRHERDGATSAVAGAATGGTTARRRLLAGMALGAASAASGVALTATAGWLIARAAEHPPVLMLMVAIVGVRTFGLARPVLRYAERLVSHDVALRLLAERRAAVYDALVPLVPARLGRERGDLLTSLVDDVDSLVDRHLRVRAPWVTFGAVGVLAVGFAAWVLPPAALPVAAVLGVGALLTALTSRLGVARAEPAYVTGRASVSRSVVHVLQGAGDLQMWQATGRALDDVDAASVEVGRAAGRSQRAVGAGRALAVLASGLGVVAVAAVGAPALAAGSVSGPMLALLVLLPLALHEVVGPLAEASAVAVRVAAADRRLASLAATEPAVADPAEPRPLTDASPAIRLDHVTAAWTDGPAAVTDVDLDLPRGCRVGVVGPSGSGKSTLAAVLLRFLDPAAGTLWLGDDPARTLLLADVRRTVGLVDDDPHIFASTLRENIRLARPGADDPQIVAALSAAQLGGWLAALPGGLDTRLGEGAAGVSGGERARIGLARAVLADLPVLVLDEPTAHLDAGTARAVADDLLDGAAGRSVVWITHGTIGLEKVDTVLDLGGSAAPVGGELPVGRG